MRYKACQNSFVCPDKFGHFLGFFSLAWWFNHFAGLNTGIIIVLLLLGVEVYEAIDENKPFDNWFALIDTQRDLMVDFLGLALAIFIYPFWSWFWWFVSAFLAVFFVRFVSWEELKAYWWDLRFWKYLPLPKIWRKGE